MKILEVCTVSSSTYALVFERAQALNERYISTMQIDVLCTDGPEVPLMRAKGMQVITCTLHRSLNPIQLLRSAWNLRQAIKQGGYEVVHLHFGVPGLVGRALALFNRKTTWIYQSHGYSIAENTSPLARQAYLLVEKFLKNTVRYSLFQLREDMVLAKREQLLDENQMVYIGNGIDIKRFKPVETATHKSTSPSKQAHKTIFGMVARFEPIKNHALLLEAVEILARQTRDFQVKLIGQGHLKAAIQADIVAKGLSDVIEIAEYSHDMPDFYRGIDVGLLTSYAEGIPRALIEPMACGKPVICTNVKGSREAIIDQVTGFKVPLESPQSLADAMYWCIRHPDKRQQMGKSAHKHVSKHFSEAQVLDILAKVYLSCRQTQALMPHLAGNTP